MEELYLQPGTVAAVAPSWGDDGEPQEEEFWLLHVKEVPRKLYAEEDYTDSQGNSFPPSTWLVKGYWLEKTEDVPESLSYSNNSTQEVGVEVSGSLVGGSNAQGCYLVLQKSSHHSSANHTE